MNVFLTGHRGFIGSAVHRLVPEARLLETKSLSSAELAAQLKGIDCVVHLAGGGGPKLCAQNPRKALESNVQLTYRLVQAARLAGVQRFVFASTIAVYGTLTSPPNPISEFQVGPDDLYGSLKLACEEFVRDAPHTILRLANVYGFGTGAHLEKGGFINTICQTARETGAIALSSATLGMDFVHVNDVARAFLLAACSEGARDATLNIGSGRAETLVQCAQFVERAIGKPIHITIDDRPGYQTRYLDIAAAAKRLGWQPTVTLADGIAELLVRT